MQLHDDPLIMLGVACSCFIVPSGGAWYILNISCRSVASLFSRYQLPDEDLPPLSQLSQVKLNLVYLLLLNFTLYSLPDQCFALALTELK